MLKFPQQVLCCICVPFLFLPFLATFLMILQAKVWVKTPTAVAALLAVHCSVVHILEVFAVVAPLEEFRAKSAADLQF